MVKAQQLILAILLATILGGCADDFDDISDSPGTSSNTETLDEAFERTPLEVPLPYTPEAVRKAMKVGQISVFRTHEIRYAPKKEESFTMFQKEVVEVGEKFFKARISLLDWNTGKPTGKSKVNKGAYDQAKVTYSQFTKENTKIFDQEIQMAGRKWKVRVYEYRHVVDFQEQKVTIWNSLEYPGLALKMVFKGPRISQEIKLVEFRDVK